MITKTRLLEFGRRHPDALVPLRTWTAVMRRKRYRHHLDVLRDFPRADFIGPHRAVFNICGNTYRLIVDLRYDLGRVYVRHVVTHAVYTRLSRLGGL